jgi:hypothetical protein
MSLAIASNWLWNFAIGYATPYLVNESTPGMKTAGLGVKVFLIWVSLSNLFEEPTMSQTLLTLALSLQGSTCAGCALFTFFFVAETKGLSLEQVDELYKNSSIVRSNAYRKVILGGCSRRLAMFCEEAMF